MNETKPRREQVAPCMPGSAGSRAAGAVPESYLTCAFCGNPAEGNFSIHRDGFAVGPEVDLCDACGGNPAPTEWEIWERIALPADHEFAHRRMPAQ